jgi:hypothetical protein
MGVVLLEHEPTEPLDPYAQIVSVVEDGTRPGVWVALDAKGKVLLELTKKGALDIAARKDIPLG